MRRLACYTLVLYLPIAVFPLGWASDAIIVRPLCAVVSIAMVAAIFGLTRRPRLCGRVLTYSMAPLLVPMGFVNAFGAVAMVLGDPERVSNPVTQLRLLEEAGNRLEFDRDGSAHRAWRGEGALGD